VLVDGHPGGSVNALRAVNPAVPIHEDSEIVGLHGDNDPIKVDKKLDMFDPNNGYNPNGNSDYSKEFQKKYTAAQAEVPISLCRTQTYTAVRSSQNS
jgi:hypothetical protein